MMDFRSVTELIDFAEFLPDEILRPWLIYALVDPRTDEVRYIGATCRAVRLAEHLHSAKRHKTHKARWIAGLLEVGMPPVMVALERCAAADWVSCERFWIRAFRQLGARLTNHTDGGEGASGVVPGAATRAKLAELARQNHTGRKRSPESRARMSAARRRYLDQLKELGIIIRMPPKTPEVLQRMSEAQRGKKASEETRRKLSISARERATPERRARWAAAARARSSEWKAWFAKNQNGVPKSPEHKAKIAAATRGVRKRGRINNLP